MARDDDDETRWGRQLLVGLGALVAVALVVGGVFSVFALGAAKVSGIDDSRPAASQQPSLYIPSGTPTTRIEPYPAPQGASTSASPGTASPSPSDQPSEKAQTISLQAFPQQVRPHQRINLTGLYQGGEGARLTVQRFENGWVDFPVAASVSGGQFATYITTGQAGVNRLRVVDKTAKKVSNPVRVTVG
jgi:hypothetical protein